MDSVYGNNFWSTLPEGDCSYNKYDVTYEGKATKITDPSVNGLQTLYSLITNDITFAFTSKATNNIYGHNVVLQQVIDYIQHPKLIVHESQGGSLFKKQGKTIENLDLFAYVNSEFVYVDNI